MNEKHKVLICGNVNGKFNTLFSRVETINKKSGPFDFLLCVGNFFGEDNSQLEAYKNNVKKVTVSTYILGPLKKSEESEYGSEGNEIVPNVVYIGKRGVFTTSSGLKIGYLSGMTSVERQQAEGVVTFNGADCGAVRDASLRGQTEYRGIDILATSMWPALINDDKMTAKIEEELYSEIVSWLALHVKPRYHFVASPDKFYERSPYRNLSTQQDFREGTTRFIAVAPVGNAAKEKWLYACSLMPIKQMRMTDLLEATTDETACPYDAGMLKQHTPGQAVKHSGNGQFFYDMDSDSQGKRKRHGDHKDRKRPEFNPDSCWFCLSSPSVERHLVISVGEHCYLALAKGPLTPDHVMVLPIAHHQSITKVPDEVREEIKKFKECLKKMFASSEQLVVFYERNYKTSHLQIQCVPVPKMVENQLLEVFQDEAGIQKIQLDLLPPYSDVCQVALPGAPYFHAELPGGEQLYARTNNHFPLQFGRDVLSSPPILDCECKSDWRECQLTREDEVEHVAKFRERFKEYDFTAEAEGDADASSGDE